MLALGLMTRDTGEAASVRLEIDNPVDALAFDLAVSARLLRFDNDKDDANKKWWARFIGGADAVPDDDAEYEQPQPEANHPGTIQKGGKMHEKGIEINQVW